MLYSLLTLLHLTSSSASALPRSSAAPAPSLLVTNTPPGPHIASCLHDAFYGTYGASPATQQHIYLPSASCLSTGPFGALSSGSIVPLPLPQTDLGRGKGQSHIVWVGQAGVDPALLPAEVQGLQAMHRAARDVMDASATMVRGAQDAGGQIVFDALSADADEVRRIELMYVTPHAMLLSVPNELLPTLDMGLPAHLVPVALPFEAYTWEPVPRERAEYLGNLTKGIKFDVGLNKVLEGLDEGQLRRDVRYLTGEAPSGIESRHSFTQGARDAAKWIKKQAESTGAICTLHHFLEGFSPNVICTYPTSANISTDEEPERVILSAHYDSRGSFGQTRAPGGDDDGSGSGHLLAIARAVGKGGVKFDKQVTFAWFAGEEQGLLGSHAYAEVLAKRNATVLLQVQADMLGYHVPGEPLQLGLPESIALPEASELVRTLARLYAPELVVGLTAACCSDHQSFLALGFPSTQVFERNGWIADPMYHNSGDTSQREGYDLEQVASIAKVTFATMLTVAGWSV